MTDLNSGPPAGTEVFSPEKRSAIMSLVRSKNTKPELLVRSLLHRMGYRFRLHRKDLPGSPDMVLPKYRTAIFVHGCFWHQHSGCKKATLPNQNAEFWREKFERNVRRDENAQRRLREMGWRVLVLWECEVKRDADALPARLKAALSAGLGYAWKNASLTANSNPEPRDKSHPAP